MNRTVIQETINNYNSASENWLFYLTNCFKTKENTRTDIKRKEMK